MRAITRFIFPIELFCSEWHRPHGPLKASQGPCCYSPSYRCSSPLSGFPGSSSSWMYVAGPRSGSSHNDRTHTIFLSGVTSKTLNGPRPFLCPGISGDPIAYDRIAICKSVCGLCIAYRKRCILSGKLPDGFACHVHLPCIPGAIAGDKCISVMKPDSGLGRFCIDRPNFPAVEGVLDLHCQE